MDYFKVMVVMDVDIRIWVYVRRYWEYLRI